MLSTIKLRTLAIFITCTLAVYLCFSVLESKFHNERLKKLNTEWDHYRSYQNERVRLRAHLISALGYGGLIHVYDNYILRKTDELRHRSWKSFGNVKAIIDDLNRLAKSEGERVSLSDIIAVVDQMGSNLLIIEQGIEQGLSSTEIHKSVNNVNYNRAFRALTRLGEELINQSPDIKNEKFNLSVTIRSLVGLNGMIKTYKRYVLHGEEDDAIKTKNYIDEINKTATAYLNLNPDIGERIALEDIMYTIKYYENGLKVIKARHAQTLSPEEIDKEVEIDDSIALRGFELLESEKIHQIESRAGAVATVISDMQFEKSIYSIFHFTFFVALIFAFNFIMRLYIIKPIQHVSDALTRLSEGELDVDLNKKELTENEIGKLESAFRIFKKHEIKRRESEEQLLKLAMTDNLTGLANRTKLEKRYSELVAIAKRKNETVATFMLDLDNFKAVNDTFGHATGDKLLQTVSEILKSELRETDIVARVGGDEFVVVLYAPETEKDVSATAQRLIEKMAKIVPVSGSDIRIGTSIGIVMESNNHTADINDVLEKADRALYEAKNTGKNKYTYHSDLLKFKNSVRQIG